MHVVSSLVNYGLNVNPSCVKKSTEVVSFSIGRLTKIDLFKVEYFSQDLNRRVAL
jgi:hypothetical protein